MLADLGARGCGIMRCRVDANLMGNTQCYQSSVRHRRAATEILPRPQGSGLAADGLLQGSSRPPKRAGARAMSSEAATFAPPLRGARRKLRLEHVVMGGAVLALV